MSKDKMDVTKLDAFEGDAGMELKLDKHMAAALAELGIDPGKYSVIGPIKTEDELHADYLDKHFNVNMDTANLQQFGRLKRLPAITPSRNKREGPYDHARYGIQDWRKKGAKARQIRKRLAIRNGKLAAKFAKDPNAKGRAYNLQAAQGDQFGEVLFPTITVDALSLGNPVPPRPQPWYFNASYVRRQKKKGKQ